MITRFPDYGGFTFSIGYNGEFQTFEKKMLKNWKLKILKITNVVLRRPMGGKIRTSFIFAGEVVF